MHELLSPAGDMESLYQAIHNGADAIYLGMKRFGARKFSKNFSSEEIIEAIKVAHLYGVKIYVTMNTLVKDNEVEAFLDDVTFLYENGVDAILMQDFGMISLVRRMYPELVIHASTQFNNSSIQTIKFLYDMGIKRVVLSRELTLEEINSIDIPIEKEVFIHGALCISYSGNCLMSSMMGGRSGNRGECAGSCRLKYSLYKDDNLIQKDKYLLSTREFSTIYNFDKLLNSDITSFKIEGRMKSPEYVGFITRLYRKLIDREKLDIEEELNKLKTLFNRKFTNGNLFDDKEFMNIDTPNHIGLEIGKVISVDKDKIKIKLNKELNQEDGIRFLESGKGLIVNYLYDDKMKLISSSDNIVYIDNKIDLNSNDRVFKTYDKLLNEKLKKYELKRIPISIELIAKKDKKIKLIFNDGINNIEAEGNVVEEAKTSPISKERIKEQLEKLGNTPFISKDIELDIDNNIFISIKELNDLRREVTKLLIEKREYSKRKIIKNEIVFEKGNSVESNYKVASIYTEEQLITCLNLGFKRVYVNDLNLYNKYKNNDRVYYFVRRNLFNISNYLQDKNIISEYFNFNNMYGNYSLNVYNVYTAYFLDKLGLKNIPISVELSDEEIDYLYNNFYNKFSYYPNLEILVYGRVENMIIKNNRLELKENETYQLVDFKNRKFNVFYKNGLTHILNYENIDRSNNNYIKRYDFYDEDKNKIEKIINN